MAERTPVVAANWKMHKTVAETAAFLDRFLPGVSDLAGTELFICPPFTSLATATERCRRSEVLVAAQNMHEESRGAFTGEVAPQMRSEEHTSELQSLAYLVCRLLLEKKNTLNHDC